MKRETPGKGIIAGAVAALLLTAGAAWAQPTSAPPRKVELADFKVVYERNIFNPKRSARGAPEPKKETARPARVDSLSLVGIMAYDKGVFAFFDGSSSSFKKAVQEGEGVGDLKLVRIEPSQVVLEARTNKLTLEIGSQLRREDGGVWHAGGRAESSDSYVSASRPTAPPTPPPAASTSSQEEQTGGWPGFFPGGSPFGFWRPDRAGPGSGHRRPTGSNSDANANYRPGAALRRRLAG